MDMMTMGLMGTVVGASAVGIAGMAKSVTDTLLPGMLESNNHKHHMRVQLHSQRCDALHRWRAGLADARDAYRQWECGPRTDDPPNVVGDEWFEGLRPHLAVTGEAAKFRAAHEVHCDNPTLTLLSLEMGRIEHEWTEEAKGRRRRRRSRSD
ncbi:hypothetical protein A5647_15510 [Mycobacterium sp. 1100029.7]|nr:hypothetical protein A5647_15510 [Mycobacterium sp. 1100029.7]